MPVTLYLISPRGWDANDFASGVDAEADPHRLTRMGPLGILTVAALAPADVTVRICDEHVEAVDFDADVDVVGISANGGQASRAFEIAREFRARHKRIVIGGPHVSLVPSVFEGGPFDCLVIGELESMADDFFADLLAGSLKPRYVGDKPDLSSSPLPRWDLYPNERALVGAVQTSRGCPYPCEYCDVIQYLGRKQRHKSDAQVLAEVGQLYDLGYNSIYLVDDNFTVHRKRAKSLLTALRDWNGAQDRDYVRFMSQVSIDIARDETLLRLCAEAGLTSILLGIESVNPESMREVNKHQNATVDLTQAIDTIVRHGIQIEAALMVGFDHDGLDIFERQYEFAAKLPIANFRVSMLRAPLATPLYARMKSAGRIVDDGPQIESLHSNIQPARMSREQLALGTQWLISRLYHPRAFADRMRSFAEVIAPDLFSSRGGRRLRHRPATALAEKVFAGALRGLMREDAEAGTAIREVLDLSRRRPEIRDAVSNSVADYALRFRNLQRIGIYRADLAVMEAPPFKTTLSTP